MSLAEKIEPDPKIPSLIVNLQSWGYVFRLPADKPDKKEIMEKEVKQYSP